MQIVTKETNTHTHTQMKEALEHSLELMELRGMKLDESCIKRKVKSGGYSVFLEMIWQCKENKKKKRILVLSEDPSGKNLVKAREKASERLDIALVELCKEQSCQSLLVIVLKENKKHMERQLNDLEDDKVVATYNCEFWSIGELSVNPFKHDIYKFTYRILSEEEILKLEKDYLHKRTTFPKLSRSDAVRRWLDCPSHSVILEEYIGCAGEPRKTYRIAL